MKLWQCVAICIHGNLVHINIWKYGNKLFFCKRRNKSSSHYLNMFSIGQANEDWWSLMHAKGNQNQISALAAPMFNKSSSHLILIKYVNKFQITCQGINHAGMFWHILKQVATDMESLTSVPNFAWLITKMKNKPAKLAKFLTLTNSKVSWISKIVIQAKVQIFWIIWMF